MNLHSRLSNVENYRYSSVGQRAEKNLRAGQQRVRYLPGLDCRQHWPASKQRLWVISLPALRLLRWVRVDISGYQLRYNTSGLNGHLLLELDGAGRLLSREAYYPFGGSALWATRSQLDSGAKTLRYACKERDSSGLYAYGYRYYAPWLMRWLNPDPAGTVDGLNLLCMCRNNPIGLCDSDGRMADDGSRDSDRNQKTTILPPLHQPDQQPVQQAGHRITAPQPDLPQQVENVAAGVASVHLDIPSTSSPSAAISMPDVNTRLDVNTDIMSYNDMRILRGQWRTALRTNSPPPIPSAAGNVNPRPHIQGGPHQENISIRRGWFCPEPECNQREFASRADLLAHVELHDDSLIPWWEFVTELNPPSQVLHLCAICGRPIPRQDYENHINHHRDLTRGNRPRCDRCERVFESRAALDEHIRLHPS